MRRICLLGLFVVLLATCSSEPLTQDELALRQERVVDAEIAKEQRKAYTRACNDAGGYVLIDNRYGNRPTVKCIKRW